jgi:hypothetical protein
MKSLNSVSNSGKGTQFLTNFISRDITSILRLPQTCLKELLSFTPGSYKLESKSNSECYGMACASHVISWLALFLSISFRFLYVSLDFLWLNFYM